MSGPPDDRSVAAIYALIEHKLDTFKAEVFARLDKVCDQLETHFKQIAVHAVQIAQSDERRERAHRDTHQRIRHTEERIERVEEWQKAHSNGKAE